MQPFIPSTVYWDSLTVLVWGLRLFCFQKPFIKLNLGLFSHILLCTVAALIFFCSFIFYFIFLFLNRRCLFIEAYVSFNMLSFISYVKHFWNAVLLKGAIHGINPHCLINVLKQHSSATVTYLLFTLWEQNDLNLWISVGGSFFD